MNGFVSPHRFAPSEISAIVAQRLDRVYQGALSPPHWGKNRIPQRPGVRHVLLIQAIRGYFGSTPSTTTLAPNRSSAILMSIRLWQALERPS
jgi:hypothetical protein